MSILTCPGANANVFVVSPAPSRVSVVSVLSVCVVPVLVSGGVSTVLVLDVDLGLRLDDAPRDRLLRGPDDVERVDGML